MSDPEIRVGDAEREEALQALGDHMSAGRLDIDEYGERTARVAASKTRGDLLALFKDLPDPKPAFLPPATVQASPMPEPSTPAPRPTTPVGARIYAAIVPVAWIVAAVLFFAVKTPFIFALPVIVMMVGASVWGDDWSRARREHRERQIRHREHRQQWKNQHRKYWEDRRRYWDGRPRRDDYS
ncbi:hypothetical protein JOF56_003169 [Kibdelosporangium banguiense]|uniref:DUF1707 domain-containing protein n=1 Tax=Kibdelosporangium banguiense TaxID=1365924 RepID=A0ABS4TEE4_9PSEU|nr:DUF1707 domain-containing protein [Kibdelosporangium banguiense]MBP2322784.1 hypothetical protein [Kibdelosporangium banguiense]